MPTWSSVSDVARRLAYSEFTATSHPSTTDVDEWLDEAEAQVRQTLEMLGLSSTLDAGTDERLVARARVVDYACAEVLAAWSAQRPELYEQAQDRKARWDAFIEELRNRPTALGAELDDDGVVPEARARSNFVDADGAVVAQRVQMGEVYD